MTTKNSHSNSGDLHKHASDILKALTKNSQADDDSIEDGLEVLFNRASTLARSAYTLEEKGEKTLLVSEKTIAMMALLLKKVRTLEARVEELEAPQKMKLDKRGPMLGPK